MNKFPKGTMKKIFAALVVLLLAYHSVGAQTPKPGGKIVFALEADVSTMNPFVRMLSTDH